jgi:hypothetical protein
MHAGEQAHGHDAACMVGTYMIPPARNRNYMTCYLPL